MQNTREENLELAAQLWVGLEVSRDRLDACFNGQKLKILAVKDEYTRVCLALVADVSMKSQFVQQVCNACFSNTIRSYAVGKF